MDVAEQKKTLVEIGERIRRRRRELDQTQEQLAEAAQLSKSFLSEIEGGQGAANGLVYLRIAQALDLSVHWLLTGVEPEESKDLPGPVTIPPLLSELAEEKKWSHRRTLDVAAALDAIVARRTREGRRWEPSREQILRIARAFPDEG